MSSDTPLTVESERFGATLRITVAGELDMVTEPALVQAVREALAQTDADRVVLDLSAIGFIDSSGLRALLLCRDSAGSHGVAIALAAHEGPVTRLLQLAGVTEWFVYD